MNNFTSIRMTHLFNTSVLKWSAGFLVLILIQISVLKYLALARANIVVQPDLILILLLWVQNEKFIP